MGFQRHAAKACGCAVKYLCFGYKEVVAEFVASKIPDFSISSDGYEALGTLDENGKLLGGVIYYEYRAGEIVRDVRMAIAGEPGWLNRGLIRAYFEYPFCQLDCTRITVVCAKPNKRSRQFAERFGFVMEGRHKNAVEWHGKPADLISYGLERHNCKWIENNGKIVTKAA